MGKLNATERRLVAEHLSAWLRQVFEDEDNEIDFHVECGLERGLEDDLESVRVRPNGTSTLVVRVNGGARATASPDEDLPRQP